RVPRSSGEGVSSQRRRADLSCTCPLSGTSKAGNQKLETGTRLHNEAWSAGAAAPSSVLAARHTRISPRIWRAALPSPGL
ncbi:unnamed protein product, partial [Staurois parvus]